MTPTVTPPRLRLPPAARIAIAFVLAAAVAVLWFALSGELSWTGPDDDLARQSALLFGLMLLPFLALLGLGAVTRGLDRLTRGIIDRFRG